MRIAGSVRTMSLTAAIGLVACGRDDLTAPPPRTSPPLGLTASASVLPFDVLGASHVPPGQACKAVGYHQFDFWVGNWDVHNADGSLGGTNVVKSRLGGCVVEENWTG